jgi:predicted CoA-binding protein
MKQAINSFFDSSAFAVVGVSANRKKFGNMAYRAMKDRGFVVFPVHPGLGTVEGDPCFPSVGDLPGEVTSVITVVPPSVTEGIVSDCIAKGIRAIWMQPGSHSATVIQKAREAGIVVIEGQCIMMFLEPVNGFHAFHRWVKRAVGSYPR